MIWHYPLLMLRCLLETLIIELGIAMALGVRKRDLGLVGLVNIFTNPLVTSFSFLVLLNFGRKYVFIAEAVLELAALLAEYFIYKKGMEYRKIKPFLLALILNISSLGIGEIINYIERRMV